MKDIYYFDLINKSLSKNKYHCFEKNLIYEDAIYEILEEKKIDIVFVMSSLISDYRKLKKYSNPQTKIIIFVEEYDEEVEIIKNNFEFVYDINLIDESYIIINILGENEHTISEKNIL